MKLSGSIVLRKLYLAISKYISSLSDQRSRAHNRNGSSSRKLRRIPNSLDAFERPLLADSVEKVAPLSGLRQNLCIGQQGSTQHDGKVIELAGTAVLLVQP